MARVLWLSNETPDVHGQGGQRRQYFLLRSLVEAGHEVEVGSLAGPQDDSSVRALVGVTRLPAPWHSWARFGVGRSGSEDVLAFLRRPAERVVVAHAETWWTFRHLLSAVEAPVLVDFHNVLSDWHRRSGYRGQARRWARTEREILARAHTVTVCSARERTALGAVAGSPDARVLVLPHGVDPSSWTRRPDPASEPIVRLFGTWDWQPNRAGMEWFLTRVWPGLEASLRCEVAGTGAEWVARRGVPGVEVVGRVANLPAFLSGARAVAVPVRDGVGAPVKFFEAVASGVPAVATTDGAPVRPDLAGLVGDDPDEWRAWLRGLAVDDVAARARAAQARASALAELSWRAVSAPLLEWVDSEGVSCRPS